MKNRKGRPRFRTPAYGHHHQVLRRQFAPLVAAGGVACARCGELIEPGSAWDLGHSDDGLGYNGPEHAYRNQTAPHINNTSRRW